jgi:FkbM family methyltransferase
MGTITLENAVSPQRRIALGQQGEFTLRGCDGPVEAQFFLKHDGIFYLTPLSQSGPASVRVNPEAPGTYTLCVGWRQPTGETGWAETTFEVEGPRSSGGPELVQIPDGPRAWVPSRWESTLSMQHEERVLKMLSRVVKPGATVYDVGANIGLFSLRFARWVGAAGHVYCIEANPLCVYFLRANMQLSGARNFDILPVCALDTARLTEFTISYGNNLLGVAQDSPFSAKAGHHIHVDSASLDALIESLHLRAPDFIKVDIEGAEGTAVAGMLETISRSRPVVMFELHGRTAAAATLAHLAPAGYRYHEVSGGRDFAAARELSDWFPDACLQVIGFPD